MQTSSTFRNAGPQEREEIRNAIYDVSHGGASSFHRFVRGLQMCRRAETVSTEQARFSLADQETSLPAR